MSSDKALFPPLLWAQRLEYILITVSLQDCQNVKLQLPDDGRTFFFSCDTPATSTGEAAKHYMCRLPLYRAVSPEESQHVVRPRQVEIKLKKRVLIDDAKDEDVNWPRLTETTTKNKSIQIDWSRWLEDDLEEAPLDGFGEGGELDLQELQMNARKEAAAEAGIDESEIPRFGSMKDVPGENQTEEPEDDDMPPLEEEAL
ncbi:unnamed protein product [Phytomonas sp. EM1]|eukprot:CCW60480.1 unnamed protein product [Phytomonas sp. isolate EM1]